MSVHAVFPIGNASQRLTGTLFPLQQRIALLQSKIQVVELGIVQQDLLLVLSIP